MNDKTSAPVPENPSEAIPDTHDVTGKVPVSNGHLYVYSGDLSVKSPDVPEGYRIIAVMPVISADESGMYDFPVELSENVREGEEMIYIANSSEPSEDDSIAEFYDTEGTEIRTVPENRRITVSVWLRKGIIYSPVLAVKGE